MGQRNLATIGGRKLLGNYPRCIGDRQVPSVSICNKQNELPAMTRQTVELASVSHDPASHSHALVCGIWTFSSTEYPLPEHTWMSGAKLTVKLAVLIALLLIFPAPVAVVSLRVSLYPLCVSCRIPQVTSSTPLESLFCQSPSEREPKYFL